MNVGVVVSVGIARHTTEESAVSSIGISYNNFWFDPFGDNRLQELISGVFPRIERQFIFEPRNADRPKRQTICFDYNHKSMGFRIKNIFKYLFDNHLLVSNGFALNLCFESFPDCLCPEFGLEMCGHWRHE